MDAPENSGTASIVRRAIHSVVWITVGNYAVPALAFAALQALRHGIRHVAELGGDGVHARAHVCTDEGAVAQGSRDGRMGNGGHSSDVAEGNGPALYGIDAHVCIRETATQRTVLSIGHLESSIIEHFGDGPAFGCEIVYAREEQLISPSP
jgi:hypothetical protein